LEFLGAENYTSVPDQTFPSIVFPYHFASRLSEKSYLLMEVKSSDVAMSTEETKIEASTSQRSRKPLVII